ncbi:hypothetical protein [Cupriavidus necator]
MTTQITIENPSSHPVGHGADNIGPNFPQTVMEPGKHRVGESNPISFYRSLFERFKEHLLRESPGRTAAITKSIKDFFCERFSQRYEVLLSSQDRGEYLTDVLVTTFLPTNVFGPGHPFTCHIRALRVILAVESELGGAGACSPGPLMRNFVEDYLKLLLIRSKYRVMVFTSLPYSGERDDHVLTRAKMMKDLYSRTEEITGGALLIHLDGANSRDTSNQVKVTVGPGKIRGFIISPDGSDVVEIGVASSTAPGSTDGLPPSASKLT